MTTGVYSPVVVETAVEFGVAGEAGVGEARSTYATLQAAFVVGHIHHSHDVAIADGPAAHTAEGHRHFANHTIFGHHHSLTGNKNRSLRLPATQISRVRQHFHTARCSITLSPRWSNQATTFLYFYSGGSGFGRPICQTLFVVLPQFLQVNFVTVPNIT